MNRTISMSIKKFTSILGVVATLSIAGFNFFGGMYADIAVLKNTTTTQNQELISISRDLVTVSQDTNKLLNEMSNRLTKLETITKTH